MELQQASEYARKIMNCSWVKWVHPGSSPANTNEERKILALGVGSHCGRCLNLNGGCFVVGKCPELPLHPNCHCYTVDVPSIAVSVECPIIKFTNYLFDPQKSNGKTTLFEDWGYTINDSEYLQQELERQATIAYQCGEYKIGELNQYGQRINIRIILTTPNGQVVSFMSGWMVYPDGRLVNATPYGDN